MTVTFCGMNHLVCVRERKGREREACGCRGGGEAEGMHTRNVDNGAQQQRQKRAEVVKRSLFM